MNVAELNVRTGQVVDAAMRVHSYLGPGLLESAYEECLAYDLRRSGLSVATQAPVPIRYHGLTIEVGYRADLIIDDAVIVELKALRRLAPVHEMQLLSYLRFSDKRLGLLINFHEAHLKNGIKRLVNDL